MGALSEAVIFHFDSKAKVVKEVEKLNLSSYRAMSYKGFRENASPD